jgi:hypothetical protein
MGTAGDSRSWCSHMLLIQLMLLLLLQQPPLL